MPRREDRYGGRTGPGECVALPGRAGGRAALVTRPARRTAMLALALLIAAGVAGAQDARRWAVESTFEALAQEHGAESARIRVLADNAEAWYARWYVLSRAKESIDVTYFIMRDDAFGRSMLGLLLQKANQGVHVRLMLDGRGSGKLARTLAGKDLLQELMQHGNVDVRVYRTTPKALLSVPLDVRNAIASNHDKLIIVDGEWLVTGGRNIEAKYFADPADLPKGFRDTDVVLQGRAVAARAKRAFDEEFDRWDNAKIHKDWFGNWDSKSLELELASRVMNGFLLAIPAMDPAAFDDAGTAALVEEMNAELALYPRLRSSNVGSYDRYEPFWGDRPHPVVLLDKSSRLGKLNEITGSLLRIIGAAQKQIVIQNPYVVLTESAREALKQASARGVQILIHTNGPDSFDHLVTQATFLREWQGMLGEMPTARIFVYRGPATVHAKVFTFDDRISIVGSYNMDPMSEAINGESICLVRGPEFARRERLRIERDLKHSDEWRLPGVAPAEAGTLGASGPPSAGPPPEAVKGALELLRKTGLANLIRPMM